jgi:hypothetical protein
MENIWLTWAVFRATVCHGMAEDLEMNKFRLCGLLLAVSVLFAVQAPSVARASTLSYDVTLTSLIGPESGGGSFSITVPASGSGVLTDNHGLTAMNVNVGPAVFGLTDTAVSYSYIGTNLVLTGLSGTSGTDTLFSITFGSGGLYTFTDSANASLDSFGLVSLAQASVSQTPLPTSLPLLLTGLGIIAMIGWYRKRSVGSYFAV